MNLPSVDLSTTAVVDFETYYDKDYSLKNTSHVAYVRDNRFDAYMVSVVSPQHNWVGHPSEFPWRELEGWALAAHNASFDQCVIDELGLVAYRDFYCTADLSAFLQAPRYLGGASKYLLGKTMSKEVRAAAAGKRWPRDFSPEERTAMRDYALMDSRRTWEILEKHLEDWPEKERKLSSLTRRMAWHGAPTDLEVLEEAKDTALKRAWEIHRSIPWIGETDPVSKKPYTPLSTRAFRIWCGKAGVPVPRSIAVDDPRFHSWDAKHGDKVPWARMMQEFRSANSHVKKIQAMLDRVVEQPKGSGVYRLTYGLKYYGADTTGRWSGDSGFNTQNMTKGEKFGVDLRALIRTPKPKVFGIIDLSNIEPRCLAFLCRDRRMIEMVKQGYDIYEAHARLTMGYTDERPLKRPDSDPAQKKWAKFRDLAKVRVLQLGYGSGWHKLYLSAKKFGQLSLFEDEFTADEKREFEAFVRKYNSNLMPVLKQLDGVGWNHSVNAWKQVCDFRETNPKITGLWREMEADYRAAAGGDFEVELPSGRAMRYFNVRPAEDGVVCQTERGGPFLHFYGAKFVENLCQATARDVFAEGLLRITEEIGLPCLQVHDEVVIEADSVDECREKCEKASAIFATTPSWLGDTPLASEYQITPHYTK